MRQARYRPFSIAAALTDTPWPRSGSTALFFAGPEVSDVEASSDPPGRAEVPATDAAEAAAH